MFSNDRPTFVLYAVAGLLLLYEAYRQYESRPSKQREELYEEARRMRLRKVAELEPNFDDYEY